MSISVLLETIDRATAALAKELAAAYPDMKRGEIGIFLNCTQQLRQRMRSEDDRITRQAAHLEREAAARAAKEARKAANIASAQAARDQKARTCARKTRYDRLEDAGHAAKGHVGGQRAYACDVCEGWHLTHLSLEDFAQLSAARAAEDAA
jgi:hypothetical protein